VSQQGDAKVDRSDQRAPRRRVVTSLRPGDAALLDALRARGYEPVHAPGHILDAVALSEDPLLVVADPELPGVLDALARLRRQAVASPLPVVLVSVHSHGPDGSPTVTRPVVTEQFLARVEATVRARRRITLTGPTETPRESAREGTRDTPRGSRSRPPPPLRGGHTFGVGPARETGPRVTPRRGAPSDPPPAYVQREGRASRSRTPVTEWRPTGSTEVLGRSAPDERAQTPPSGLNVVNVPTAPLPQLPEAGSAALTQWLTHAPSSESAEGPWGAVASASMRDLLQAALGDVGDAGESLDPADPDAAALDLDQLVPPELLEPLDPALEPLDDAPLDRDLVRTSMLPPPGTQTGLGTATGAAPAPGAPRRAPGRAAAPAQAVMPLSLDGDLSLSGRVLQSGGASVLGAAARARATGTLSLRTPGATWTVLLDAGHVLSLRGSRPDAHLGALLAAYGYIPQEAARLADVPLDSGVRGAALLAARGYVSPDGLPLMLGRVAQEVFFDLLRLDDVEWELGPLERSVAVPMPTRALDALLVLGARARITPALAYAALGGDGATVTLRGETAQLASLPLVGAEREAALAAQDTPVAALVRLKGEAVLPALAALHWLQLLRAESPSLDLDRHQLPPGVERVRLRALLEAATRHDHLALLGVSPWATPAAAQSALDARRAELDAMRARYGASEALRPLYTALDEAAALLGDTAAWERFVAALQREGREPG